MATRKHLLVVRSLRVVLALAFLGTMAWVGLYLFGRQGRPVEEEEEAPTEIAASEVDPESDEPVDFAVVSEGFEFALTREDQIVFEIRGARQRSSRDGRVFLEDVGIKMDRATGPFEVRADSALYNPKNQNSRLEGNVVLRGSDGLVLESNWLRLEGEGQTVFGRGGIRFGSNDLTGVSEEIEADLDDRRLKLRGDVRIDTVPGRDVSASLVTQELDYDENGGSLLAQGGVRFSDSASTLQSSSLTATLDPDSGDLRELVLVGRVSGDLQAAGRASGGSAPDAPEGEAATQALRLEGDRLEISLRAEDGEIENFLLTSEGGDRAAVRQSRSDGSQAILRVVSLQGVYADGALARAELGGPVDIVQMAPQTTTRRARSESGEVRFRRRSGEISELDLTGDVQLTEEGIEAHGSGAFIEMATGEVEIVGNLAHIDHARGSLDAPRIVYQRSSGLARAGTGVKAVMTPENGTLGEGLSLGGEPSEEPVYVEASEALFYARPENVLFRGQVRAWQGTNTLFAEELSSVAGGQGIEASGGVRTLVVPPADAEPPPPPPPEDEAEAAPAAPSGPVDVSADAMTYDEAERFVTYRGSVRAARAWTTMSSESMRVLLDEAGAAREMQLERSVRIEDARNRRVLEGDRAVYDPNGTLVEVFGDPIRMQDEEGGAVEGGRRFLYDLATGRIQLSSREGGSSP